MGFQRNGNGYFFRIVLINTVRRSQSYDLRVFCNSLDSRRNPVSYWRRGRYSVRFPQMGPEIYNLVGVYCCRCRPAFVPAWFYPTFLSAKMNATPALRRWVLSQLKERGWKPMDLAEQTKVSHAAWSRFLNRKHRSISQDSINALCKVFDVSERDLYQIASGVDVDREVQSLSRWLTTQDEHVRTVVFRSAKRQGWQSESNQTHKPLKINSR